jgi:geranylgeranyl diphosphate synthase type I
LSAPAFLQDYARLFEPRLRAFLDGKKRHFESLPVPMGEAESLLRDYLLRGGKRLRGALVVLGHEAAGGAPGDALDASLGVELLHAYLLIHDDFMDQDEVRRGGPTLHRALGGDHLAGSLALLLGSLCESWAYQLVLGAGTAGQRDAALLMAEALEQVILGQMADLRAPRAGELGSRQVLEVQRRKTGSYSFELPLQLGATIGGASPALLDALSAYALPLGQAFQIADDLLGSFGSPEVTGKPNAGDLREGKRTLLVARALELARPQDADRLRAELGRPDADVGALREILQRSGAVDSARAEADRLCDEALRALDPQILRGHVAQALREIALYSVRRAT